MIRLTYAEALRKMLAEWPLTDEARKEMLAEIEKHTKRKETHNDH